MWGFLFRRYGWSTRRTDTGENNRDEQVVHEDTREDICGREHELAEGRVQPFVWSKEDSQERGVAIRFARIRT